MKVLKCAIVIMLMVLIISINIVSVVAFIRTPSSNIVEIVPIEVVPTPNPDPYISYNGRTYFYVGSDLYCIYHDTEVDVDIIVKLDNDRLKRSIEKSLNRNQGVAEATTP